MHRYKEIVYRMCHNVNVRNGALYTVFSFFNNGISFILVLILANYMTPSDYGSLNLYNTFVTLLSVFIALCTNSFLNNAFFQKGMAEAKKVILIILSTSTVMFLIFMSIIFFLPSLSGRLIGINVSYLYLGIFVCYFQIYVNMNLDLWRLEEKPVSYGIFTMVFAILNFSCTFFFIVTLKYNWEGRVYAQLIVTGVFFIISIYSLIRRSYIVISRVSKALIIETFIFSLPIIPHSMSFWLKQGMDRYIVNIFHDTTEVGLYSFAMNFAAIIGIVGSAFNSTNSVYIAKNLVKGYQTVRSFLSKQNRLMTLLFLGISFVVFIGSFTLIPIILPKYSGSINFLLPLCIGAYAQCLYLLYVNYIFFYKRTKTLMSITFSTALLQFGLSLWLTRYSVVFTAYISMLISIFTALLVNLVARRLLKKTSDYEFEKQFLHVNQN